MSNFEQDLIALIEKWLDVGADPESIQKALKKHAKVYSVPSSWAGWGS